jgi:hypothetical protein
MEIDRLQVNGELNKVKVQMKWGNWHGHDVYPPMKIDPAVALSSGKALGQAFQIHYWAGLNTPLCIVNQVGKGRAVLLNFSIFEAPAAPLISQLLASAGVAPVVHVTTPKGGFPKDVSVTRWNNGQVDLVSLFGTYEGNVNIGLPTPRFVCDLKGRKSLGQTSQFTTALRPNRAAFFALLPQAPPVPELRLPASARPGSVVSASLRLPNAVGQEAIRISATSPTGASAEWLNQTLIVGDQPVPLTLPFARNDPAGTWEIRATGLLDNRARTTKIDLH